MDRFFNERLFNQIWDIRDRYNEPLGWWKTSREEIKDFVDRQIASIVTGVCLELEGVSMVGDKIDMLVRIMEIKSRFSKQ